MTDMTTLDDLVNFCVEYFVTIQFCVDTIKLSIESFVLVETDDLIRGANDLKRFVEDHGNYLRKRSNIIKAREERKAMERELSDWCRIHGYDGIRWTKF